MLAPGQGKGVDPVDALHAAQRGRPVQGQARHPRREEGQRFLQLGAGQVGAQAEVRSRAEGQQPVGVVNRDVEPLRVLARPDLARARV